MHTKCRRCNHITPPHGPEGCQVIRADQTVCGCVYPRPLKEGAKDWLRHREPSKTGERVQRYEVTKLPDPGTIETEDKK